MYGTASTSSSDLVTVGRRSAMAALAFAIVALAGFLAVVGSDPMAEAATDPAFFVPTVAALAASVLVVFALLGLRAWLDGRIGARGRVAFWIALLGSVLAAGAQWTYVFVVPYFADAAPELVNSGQGILLAGFLISYATFAIGWVAFGLSVAATGVLPRWLGVLLVAGAAIALLPLPSRTLVLLVALALVARRMRVPA